MNYSEETTQIFQKGYLRLTNFHTLINNTTPILAFSGGKDSTLLANFYKYLYSLSYSPEPILFHLNHRIRDNQKQEEQIAEKMKLFATNTIVKKKKFLI
jgi:tRNA(Ile)-lysidine synthase TilS/MesJ